MRADTYFIDLVGSAEMYGYSQGSKHFEMKGSNDEMPIMDELLLEKLVIDPEFESVIPPLTQIEYDQLKKNILEDQEVYHPIIVWGLTIIDGHKRYKILQENPQIPFRTRKLEFADRYEALAWICKNQIGRRNLSDAQMTILIGRQFEAEKMTHGGVRISSKEVARPQNEVLLSGQNRTAKRIAEEHGISRATVERSGEYVKALDIAKEYDANIERDILAGGINPSKKDVIHIGRVPKEEVPNLVQRLREKKQPLSKKNAGNTIDSISARMAEDKPPATEKDMMISLDAAVKTIIRAFETTFHYYPEILKNPEHQISLKIILGELKKYLNKIEGEST